VNRLAQLNQLGPGRIIQVHLFQELVGYSLQCILGPNLLTEQHMNHALSVRVLDHKQHCKMSTPNTSLVIKTNNLIDTLWNTLDNLFNGMMIMTTEEESAELPAPDQPSNRNGHHNSRHEMCVLQLRIISIDSDRH
jgi:hypothetical protein